MRTLVGDCVQVCKHAHTLIQTRTHTHTHTHTHYRMTYTDTLDCCFRHHSIEGGMSLTTGT